MATNTTATVEVLLNKEHCYLIRNCLDHSEQITIYNDILHRSNDIDNETKTRCMNPSPKTIIFNGNQSTLKLVNDGEDNVYTGLIVQTANEILKRELQQQQQQQQTENEQQSLSKILSDSTAAGGKHTSTPTMTIGVIRYEPPNGKFPLHIDHCNDNTWVYLLSLGCSANFLIRKDDRRNNVDATKQQSSFQFKSGDVLVFDPSSDAAIVHGVNGINGDEFPLDGPMDFGRFRFGVQCRVRVNK